MILAYSITKGIGIGIISYVLIEVVTYIVDLIRYTKNKELESITLKKCNYDVLTLEINVFGVYCSYEAEHGSRKPIIKLSWKYLKDVMFKD